MSGRFALVALILLSLVLPAAAQVVIPENDGGQSTAQATDPVPVPRTEGPRETFASFLLLRDSFENALTNYVARPTYADLDRTGLIAAKMRSLIDLQDVPVSQRHAIGDTTVRAMLDIFGRIDLPDLEDIPEEEALDDRETGYWRVPGTPLRIIRTDDASRSGEWLFSQRAIASAPRYLEGIADQPLVSTLPIKSWTRFLPQIAGPAIPLSAVMSLPDAIREPWLDTPIWKIGLLSIALGLFGIVVLLVHQRVIRAHEKGSLSAVRLRLLTPVLLLVVIYAIWPVVLREVIPLGRMSRILADGLLLLTYLAITWLFWVAVQLAVQKRLQNPRNADEELNKGLIQLVGSVIGIVGVSLIVARWGQTVGIPVASVLAGLGIGGVAVALAVRPTLENLIGGIILYVDRPVQVGDYCTFGTSDGTIERIGIRSTEIRALDRTVISIPNAQFADMQLINWAQCDRMLINSNIGLRFETTSDQLRFVLAEIRKMVHAHPRIDNDTVRVRYIGPGASSRDIKLRIYALTREWNDFFAIREDVFLRVDTIVESAGTEYAFPSQTLYLGKDSGGVDETLRDAAEEQVSDWRRSRTMPFPDFPAEHLSALQGTLDYPPKGSPDEGNADVGEATGSEHLSSDPRISDVLPEDQDGARKEKPSTAQSREIQCCWSSCDPEMSFPFESVRSHLGGKGLR
ncbi:mechanosensitive ion channel family protein [Tropicimonas sp. TH_r6]|uniref:mechanosensitive ion channel family protein n=1 Tax=Tropicimonas sp. TH_r6 TaxID=3082085 RepID=UPI0029553A18|nr:mechanosensitive ion channel family protein [Tropicimonas sp. TH_r6]MDV7145804.1 mechanosensitive ion channel family protein [Tropicimonas sp. TH_r6]